MTDSAASRSARPDSGWAVGGIAFAGVMLIMIGIFHAIAGFAAIIDDDFFVVGPNYTYNLDTTGWGWIHLLLGIVVALAGFAILRGAVWGRIVGVTLAVISAVANFFYIPYYPFWALLIIAIDVFVIWALTRPTDVDY